MTESLELCVCLFETGDYACVCMRVCAKARRMMGNWMESIAEVPKCRVIYSLIPYAQEGVDTRAKEQRKKNFGGACNVQLRRRMCRERDEGWSTGM